ncbi:MAG: hypothetical protein ACRDL7_01240, partial [Gaiellaceae bacterium]
YSPWQNRAEREIQESKKMHRRLMHKFQVPKELWDYSIRYAAELRSCTVLPHLGGRTGYEILTGDTPDISHLLHFDFYQPVMYLEPNTSFPDARENLGRWLGPAHNIGQALCYYVLKPNGQVICRSTVCAADIQDTTIKQRIKQMDTELNISVGEFTPMELDVDEQEAHQYFDHEENDLLSDGLIGAEVIMQHGNKVEIARVCGRKRDQNGNLVGDKSTNLSLDTRAYVIQFPDGTKEIHAMNVLSEALYSQLDEHGQKWYIFQDILDHQKGKGGKGRTKGWLLEVLWKDGTTTWETLTSMKEAQAVHVAKYAVENQLEKDPAFSYWVPTVLRNQNRLIATMQRRRLNNHYKYGIRVPHTVNEALALDKQNKNTFWRDAIQKEMRGVECAFDIKAKGENAPDGYKKIPLRMIFTVKMDFTRKARLVAGGHKTDPPTTLTYSSVASRDSVRLAFLLAGLNDLDVALADIGNAYLNAKTKEQVYAIAGA